MASRFFPSIVMIGLILVLTIDLVWLSIGADSPSILSDKEWLFNSSELARRQSKITFTIPWDGGKLPVLHEDLMEEASTSSSSSLPTVHLDYNYGPYDFLPSTTTTTNLYPTSSAGDTIISIPSPTPIKTSDFDCTDTETTTASSCPNCGLKDIELGTGLPEMLGYMTPTQNSVSSISVTSNSQSTSYNFTADMLSFATPMGYICRPQLVPTQSALGCSVCTTVTETWHSTDYSCTATMTSSLAEITLTVTVTPSSSFNVQPSTGTTPMKLSTASISLSTSAAPIQPSISTVTVNPSTAPINPSASTAPIQSPTSTTHSQPSISAGPPANPSTNTAAINPSASIVSVNPSTSTAPANPTSGNSTVLYSLCPSESSSSPVQGPPLPTVLFSNSTLSLHSLLSSLKSDTTAVAPTSAHPCPNAGYSCSECPGGWYCPPIQTPAVTCPCGYGWACGHCAGGWFCVPGPTSTSVSSVSNSVSILSHSISRDASSLALSSSTVAQDSSPTLGLPFTWSTFTPVMSVALPVFSNIFSVVEHITADAASNSLTALNSQADSSDTTIPSIPSVTSDSISIITTSVPVSPLILPEASGSGFRRMKRRALPREDNLAP